MDEQTYGVGALARLAGVSVRTLHHYEDEGLLNPRRAPNGYRVYGSGEVERLHSIIVLRSLGLSLARIGEVLDGGPETYHDTLVTHLEELRRRRDDLDRLTEAVEETIAAMEGGTPMGDQERFRAMKERIIEENEESYGTEVRERYGDGAMEGANARLRGMDQAKWEEVKALEQAIIDQLSVAMATGDPLGPEAVRLCELHRAWLEPHWAEGTYSSEAHAMLAEGYVADPRFTAYYDGRAGEGATRFLRDALVPWCAAQGQGED